MGVVLPALGGERLGGVVVRSAHQKLTRPSHSPWIVPRYTKARCEVKLVVL